jgi:hypothetical protein
MAFPSNPEIGTPHTIGQKTWYWDGATWTLSPTTTTGGDEGVEVLDDLLDVDTGGPPTASERAYNYYINEDPRVENAWGRYTVNIAMKTIRFHRYDIDGNDLTELYEFTNPGDPDNEGTKHTAQALDGTYDSMSRVLSKTTQNSDLYYEFAYEDAEFIRNIYNQSTSKLFTIFATDFGSLVDGAILVYRQKEEQWKPEPHGEHGGGDGGSGDGAKVYIQFNAPTDAKEGDLWIHEENYYMYVLKGSTWVAVTGPEGGSGGGGGGGNYSNDSQITLNNKRGLFFDDQQNGISFTLNQPIDNVFSVSTKNITTVGMSPHYDPVDNDMWIYEEDFTLYVYKSGQWVGLTGEDKGSSTISGRLEQPCVVNGGKPFSIFCEEGASDISNSPSVSISPMPPDSAKKGDLWFDSEHLELRVYYITADSAPTWVSASHPAMRPQYTEPDNPTAITITGPTQAIQDTRTGPYRAVLSKEVLRDPDRSVVTWGVIDTTIPVTIDVGDGEESIYAFYKYNGFGVTYITAKITYVNDEGVSVTEEADPYRISVTTMAPGAPITYNVRVVEDPDQAGVATYEIDGIVRPHLNMERNRRYIFDQSHSSNIGFPLYFYEALNRDPDGSINDTININDKYQEGDAVSRYGNIVDIVTPYDAPVRLAYGSENDPDMGFWVYPYDPNGAVFDPQNPNEYPFP